MGTRGIVGIYSKGKTAFRRNSMSSNPVHLGVELIKECQTTALAEFQAALQHIVLVDEDEKPSAAQVEQVFPFIADAWITRDAFDEFFFKRTAKKNRTWKMLLDSLDISFNLMTSGLPYLVNDDEFVHSTACEWAYIMNVDTGALEVYTGHWSDVDELGGHPKRKPCGRYALGIDDRWDWGVNLLDELPLEELRMLPDYAVKRYCERIERRAA